MDPILEILEKDARTTPEEIAKMIKKDIVEVKKAVRQYEKDRVILHYKTVLNKELLRSQSEVRALIEVKVTPQRDVGFDSLAKRIYNFPEVKSCYLMSGGYDLLVTVEGKDLQTVASFVSEKLSTLENVRGTVTHFLLKKYKEDGDVLQSQEKDKRIAISF
ncbi:MAG: Lrp/AsnC family transcriptional regulator [Chlamydiae bacterium]|nr:Lrp/AsnC family transcriptional regulator [Chlamydiota bacterium]MBI3278090.1 Lrp/AsnC family transcriptional regulator [Chlamydiota bacterium]